MSRFRRMNVATVALAGALAIPASLAAQKKQATAPPPRAAQQQPKPAPVQRPAVPGSRAQDPKVQPPGPAINTNGQAGAAAERPETALQRFLKMTPDEQQKALARLPEPRRQQIMQRLQQYRTMSDRERVNNQLERLRSLPPQRQNQVRRSLQQLPNLPEERRTMVQQELTHLSAMPEEERAARMNSEEFRNVYSPAEQQMISNISTVLPPKD